MTNAPVQRIDDIISLRYSINVFKDVELPAYDDDSWMYAGEEELNSPILERQKEMETYESECTKRRDKRQHNASVNSSASQSNDFNLGDIAETMQAFVRIHSSYEGAEVPEYRKQLQQFRQQHLLPRDLNAWILQFQMIKQIHQRNCGNILNMAN